MEPQSSHIIIRSLVSGLAVLLTSWVVPGFKIRGFFTAVLAALVIAFAYWLLWWFFMFITLPLNLLTFGLFTFVVNGAILKICAAILPGFELQSWFSAIFGAIVLSIFGVLLHWLLI